MRLPTILKGNDMPKHLAISATRITEWAKKNGKAISEATQKNIDKVNEFVDIQVKKDIPVMTIQLCTNTEEEIKSMSSLIKELRKSNVIHNNKIRVFVIGEWYGLDSELTDEIRTIIDETKEYDNYFFNLCVNYDGQKELLATLKLLLKKREANKIKTDELDLQSIKDNLASSYFIPPDLIIENGGRYSGLLLWDSKGASMFFTNKYWLDFDKADLEKAITFYNVNKKSE